MLTVAVALAVPLAPVQLILYVDEVFKAPVDTEPLVDLLPLQAPDAEHEETLVEYQVRVLDAPGVTLFGDAFKVTVGIVEGADEP